MKKQIDFYVQLNFTICNRKTHVCKTLMPGIVPCLFQILRSYVIPMKIYRNSKITDHTLRFL